MSKEVVKKVKVVKKDGEELEVNLREPIALDLMAIDHIQGSAARTANMIANLSEIELEVIGALPVREFNKLDEAMQDFL
jgi:hypothetical protein